MTIAKKLVNFNAYIQYKKLQSNQPKNAEALKAIQFNKLKRLLSFSYSNFEFYRELMDNARFDPEKFHDLEEISLLPVITKNDYREFTEHQLKKHPEKYAQYFKDHTSGSTGIPLVVYRTWSERAYLLSKFLRVFFNNGYSIFDTTFGILAPTRYSGRDSILQKLGIMPRVQAQFSDPAEKLARMFHDSKADVLYGNVSSLVQMALHMEKKGMAVKPLKFYLTTGEELDENSAKTIERVFGENLINHYGSIELSTMAYRKKGEKYFNFCHDTNLLEILDQNGQASETGSNIVTDFHIYSFPMVRYELGDQLETAREDGFPMIKRIKGRKDASVVMKDGSKEPAYFLFEIFGKDLLVRQYKVVQEAWDLFKAELVISDLNEKENLSKKIIARFEHYMGAEVRLEINFVDEIAPEASGKIAKFFSKVPENRASDR
ncbi:MAG: hypothetical protein MI921_15215 [Cytophagales bacterium]|nr:hypothetical protein [Cytophagales bacterium]